MADFEFEAILRVLDLAFNLNQLKCTFSDVFDLAEECDHQRRLKEYIGKCNTLTVYTIFEL